MITAEVNDSLTNLLNSHVFDKFIEHAIANAKINNNITSCVVALIDIDNLSYINSCYGTTCGNLIIQHIGNIIKENTRDIDIISRLYGGTFGVLFTTLKEQPAIMLLQHIINKVKNTKFIYQEHHINISVSVGVATCTQEEISRNECTIETLKLKAKLALDAAKSSLKGTVQSYNNLITSENYHINYNIIDQVLKYKNVQLNFQPIIHLYNNTLFGVEVLSRIIYNNNIIFPNTFLQLMASTGRIIDLDFIVIEKACESAKKLLNSHTNLKIFINISAKAFNDHCFFASIIKMIKSYHLEQHFCIEITEHDKIFSTEHAKHIRDILRYHNISVVLDDFGSGYSSFAYLKVIEPDIIKIDGEYIKNITHNGKDEAITLAISTMAQKLNILTVAEYIENTEILDKVKSFGITLGQGYYFGKPNANFNELLCSIPS